MHWELRIDNIVQKTLRRIPKHDAERIIIAIEELIVDPYGGDIQKMRGEEDVWRRRIGSYRILYEIRTTERCISVFDVQRRASNTY